MFNQKSIDVLIFFVTLLTSNQKLQQLKSMYEEDLITEEEYNNKRQELLRQM